MDEWINKKDIIRELCLTTGCSYHDVVIGTIMEFPAADVQPVKHGKWRKRISTPDSLKCSVCGNNHEYLTTYCPNCGARMDSNKDNE